MISPVSEHNEAVPAFFRFARHLRSLLFVCPIAATAASYYVDPLAGNDGGDGTAPDHAWRSFAPVNGRSFAPGDRLLLRAGARWEGQSLQPKGSGSPELPIVVDRFGDGPDPVLAGEGRVPSVVRLDNQEGWEIGHLDISNDDASHTALLRGVEIHAADSGLLHHLVFSHLTVHDVTGPLANYKDSEVQRKSYGGICFRIEGSQRQTAWDDLRVEDCTIEQVSAIGILFTSSWSRGHRDNDAATWFPSRHVVIRGNVIAKSARNGLIVRCSVNPLVEKNLFRECANEGSGNASFAFDCDDAVFQYNEATGTKFNPGDVDASGFDSDYDCRRTIIQYNYSHDNDYGFVLLCCNGRVGFNDGTIIRGNLSINDGGNLIRVSGTVTNARIYNNYLYAKADMVNPHPGETPGIVFFKSWSGWSDHVEISNNVIVNDCPGARYDLGESTNTTFRGNFYGGIHPVSQPADPEAIVVASQAIPLSR
jgi:hypothetical protein